MLFLHRLISLVLILCVVSFTASAQISRVLPYQGMLLDTSGTAKPDGTYSLKFSLYTSSQIEIPFWSEIKTLQVSKGMIFTKLGDQVLFPDSLRFDQPYWLGIKVGIGSELTPRIALAPVPYSLFALRSDTAKFSLNSPPFPRPITPQIATTEIMAGAITTEKILDGTIVRNDVSSNFKAPYADTADYIRNSVPPQIGSIIVIGNNNFRNVAITDGAFINVKEEITLTSSYQKLTYRRLFIQGGGFIGTAGDEVRFGNNSVVVGVKFKNVNVTGSFSKFVSCTFEGPVTLSSYSVFENCTFIDISATDLGGFYEKCEISGCTITNQVGNISSSNISNCNFNNIAQCSNSTVSNTNMNGLRLAHGNYFGDSNIKLSGDAFFSQNRLLKSFVSIADQVSSVNVIGNSFNNLLTGKSEQIGIDCSLSSYRIINISGNNFLIQADNPQSISVSNNFTGSYFTLKISGNNFLKGTKAINYSSNVNTVITDNVTTGVPLGVNPTSNVIVLNNFAF